MLKFQREIAICSLFSNLLLKSKFNNTKETLSNKVVKTDNGTDIVAVAFKQQSKRVTVLPFTFSLFILCLFISFLSSAQTINDALDYPEGIFTNVSTEPWTIAADAEAKGGLCMKSGAIGSNGSTEISTTVAGNSVIIFNCKVYGKETSDYLTFFDNGIEVEKLQSTSIAEWYTFIYEVPAGSHTLTWRYAKGSLLSNGDCGAWIDNIQIIRGRVILNDNGSRADSLTDNNDSPTGTLISITGLDTMVRKDYTFTGRVTKADIGRGYEVESSYTVSGIILLYRQWQYSSSGSGTETDPYKISTLAHLQALANDVNGGNNYSGKYFLVTANIDFSSLYHSTLDSWTPIGNRSNPFSGTFDGGGYTLSNLYINNNNDNQGLFGYIEKGTVKNLTLINPIVTGSVEYNCIGTVAGVIYNNSQLEAVTVKGGSILSTTTGISYLGGVVGASDNNSKVIGCTVSGTTLRGNSSSANIGGIVGYNNFSSVIGCLSDAGSLGYNGRRARVVGIHYGTVTTCYFTTLENLAAIEENNGIVSNVAEKTITQMNQPVFLTLLNMSLVSNSVLYHYQANMGNVPKLVAGAPTTYLISGTVKNSNNKALENIVILLMTEGVECGRATTDANGTYQFKAIADNSYTLQTIGNGYQLHILPTFMLSANQTKDFVLLDDPDYIWYITNPSATTFTISTAGELKALSALVNGSWGGENVNFSGKTIRLSTNIDLSTVCNPTLGSWSPIGSNYYVFRGIFDGGGYTISNLYVNSNYDYLGLFGYVRGGIIKNLTLVNSYITGTGIFCYIGTVAGIINNDSRLEALIVTGGNVVSTSTENNSSIGGVVGVINDSGSRVIGCTVSTTTLSSNSSSANVGGVVGYNDGGSVISCLSDIGSLSIRGKHGRVVGNNSGTITTCYFTPLQGLTGIGGSSGTVTDVVEKSVTEMNSTTLLSTLNMALVTENSPFHYRINSPTIPKIISNSYTHLLSFDPGGGQMVTAYVDVKAGEPIGILPIATKAGEFFAGWKIDQNVITAATTWTYTADKTAVAQWVTKYTLTLNPSGGTVNPTTIDAGTNQPIGTLPIPMRTGYSFNGWKIDDNLITATTTWTYTANKTAVAQWNINSYTITFESSGSAINPQTVNYGNTLTKPANPSKVGNTFVGWYKESTLTTAWNFAIDVVTSDMTLYAKWSINSYTVTFKSNNGSTTRSVTVNYGSTVTKPANPVRAGYKFIGWYKESTLTTMWNFTTGIITANMTLYAKWSINSYTVTFKSNNGSTTRSVTVNYGSTVTKPANPVRAGYKFIGWYKESTLTTMWNFTTGIVTENMTLYAKWTQNPTSVFDGKVSVLKIYPNPATTVLNIQSPEQIDATSVEIFDITGKLVLQVPITSVIDISILPQGLYTVKAGNYRGKVMKR